MAAAAGRPGTAAGTPVAAGIPTTASFGDLTAEPGKPERINGNFKIHSVYSLFQGRAKGWGLGCNLPPPPEIKSHTHLH